MVSSTGGAENGHRSEVVVVSDGTGDTTTAVVQAVMPQFQTDWNLRVFGGIRHESEVRRVVEQAEDSDALAVFSLVGKRVASALLRGDPLRRADRRSARVADRKGGATSPR